MSSDEIAIRVRGLTKHYLMFERPEDRLKQMIVPRLQRIAGRKPRRYFRDFPALSGISFEIKRGETVGIIGRNGCGKSTLLQIICGTLQPTSGTVEVNGRIAALLELGAGFNPEFTGRENVYVNAAILGLSHAETEARFDDIARFADIGMFIDQPVKTYSSGMYVRLAFATAINVDPDILVVDEALSVGDEAFQRKCFARIEEIKDRGGTILFVSHGAQAIVQLCDRALLIDRGEKILEGQPKTVVNQYQRLINLSGLEAEPVREKIKEMEGRAGAPAPTAPSVDASEECLNESGGASTVGTNPLRSNPAFIVHMEEERLDAGLVAKTTIFYESAGAQISNVRFETPDGVPVNVLRLGAFYRLRYDVTFEEEAKNIRFGFQVKTVNGLVLAGSNNVNVKLSQLDSVAPGDSLGVCFSFCCRFLPATYIIDAGVMGNSEGSDRYLHRIVDACMFRVGHVIDSHDYGHFSLSTDLAINPLDVEVSKDGRNEKIAP